MYKKVLIVVALSLAFYNCKESGELNRSIDASTVDVEDKNSPHSSHSHNEALDVEEKRKSVAQQKLELEEKGFQVFEMIDEVTQDTLIMQQYFMAFLKSGPIRNQNEEEAKQLQIDHLSHLSKMYEMGYADISGPFGDNNDVRGITIYNVPTLEMADSLANSDPMVKAGRLEIEIRPWWAAKGFKLR